MKRDILSKSFVSILSNLPTRDVIWCVCVACCSNTHVTKGQKKIKKKEQDNRQGSERKGEKKEAGGGGCGDYMKPVFTIKDGDLCIDYLVTM